MEGGGKNRVETLTVQLVKRSSVCLSRSRFVRAPSCLLPHSVLSVHFLFLSLLRQSPPLFVPPPLPLPPPSLLICRREAQPVASSCGTNWEFLKLVGANQVSWVSRVMLLHKGELFTCLQSGVLLFLSSFSRFSRFSSGLSGWT